jgi:hypothetical protein
MPGICGRKRTLAERRCPFLALWMQQGPANDSKDRHKAKMENHRSLRERRPHPATLGKSPQTAANASFPPVNRSLAEQRTRRNSRCSQHRDEQSLTAFKDDGIVVGTTSGGNDGQRDHVQRDSGCA